MRSLLQRSVVTFLCPVASTVGLKAVRGAQHLQCSVETVLLQLAAAFSSMSAGHLQLDAHSGHDTTTKLAGMGHSRWLL